MVPWSRGRDFVDGEELGPRTRRSSASGARSALFLNILTEDNLPHYYRSHQRQVRQRRRLGRVEPSLDGRRGSARDRDPRLPRGDPLDRHARARACPHAPGVDGHRAQSRHHRRRHRLRRAAGARHPHLAPQHRQAARRPAGLRDHEPGRGRREPAPPLLPRPRRRPRSRSIRRAWSRPSSARCATFEMPGAGIEDFKTPRARHRRRRRLRLRRRTTTRSSCRSCSSTGGSSSCRTSRRRPSRPVSAS